MNPPVKVQAGQRTRLLRTAVVTVLAAIPIVLSLPHFFRWLESKPGMVPPEPLLHHLPVLDLSTPLFIVMYAAVVFAIATLLRSPVLLLRALQAYLLLLLFRMLTMALVTLEPPPDMMALHDPIIQNFYPGNAPYGKDLFFSGHVATVCLLTWAVPGRYARWAMIACAAMVSAAVLIQHVHWTIDVLAAPFFAWIAWRLSAHTTNWSMGKGSIPAA